MPEQLKLITEKLQNRIEIYRPEIQVRELGSVTAVGDGIARVKGLASVRSQELVQFANGVKGIAFNLEADSVGVIVMGDYAGIEEGMEVHSTGRIASVPVGDALIGRVVNALGEPIDGKGAIQTERYRTIEHIAPNIVARMKVNTPVQTGMKAIDAMVPIGRGQRELIIGDRQTGKTALAIDAIINQKDKNLICIYVAIGQKMAQAAQVVDTLKRYGAMGHTVVVVASAADPAAFQYIAPYAGCAIGEEFMLQGKDALIVYDDLTKHAWAYRQVSLLMRRPPGREAYPGDIFYLHSRLLERAAKLHPDYGGGSLTALPIIETQASDLSAYVPTNVISITDGQIYLESNLFYAGVRPAINVGLSVSRVGGDAQTKAMKQVAGKLRLEMAAYRELAAFMQFSSDLDKASQAQINRGQHLQEILKQQQYDPQSLAHQVIVIFAGTQGYADTVPVEKMRTWETELLRMMDLSYPEIVKEIAMKKRISDELESSLRKALAQFCFEV